MADEPDNAISFIGEQFRGLNGRLDGIDARLERVEGRLTRIEDRMEHLESRVSAVNHLAQSVLVEIAGINKRIANFSAEKLQVTRRLEALEAANAR